MKGRNTKLTGQIGEFLVSAELGKLGLIATQFSGNVPRFDIVVADEQGRSLPIQVKCTNSNNWPTKADQWMDITIDHENQKQIFNRNITFSNNNLLYVFVAIERDESITDRFFILKKKDVQNIYSKNYCTWMKSINWKRPKNYQSMDCRFSIQDISHFENKWNTIFKELDKLNPIF